MAIPLVNLVSQYEDLRDEVLPAVERVMRDGRFVRGEEVARFETAFARYCGVDHCVGVASGTDALHLALRALDVGPGDEVITAANTFVATAIAIHLAGATPVFVDVRPDDFHLDVRLLEEAVTAKTKAIIPVHLYGQAADMAPLLAFAEEYGLKVIEDACQAHGARYVDRPVGSFGDAACFSFYPGKNLGAYGDGGAVVTDDPDAAQRIRLLGNYGRRRKNDIATLGFNSRLDTLQAAVLLVKLPRLDPWNDRRRATAALYHELLDQPLGGQGVSLPREIPGRRHVYHLYVIQHADRDGLAAHLRGLDVHCGIHYPAPVPHTPPFASSRCVPDGVPVSTELSRRVLSLPMCPQLQPEQVHAVADAVVSFVSVPSASGGALAKTTSTV